MEATGGYEIDFYEVATNRPNVVATRKGTGGGRSLIWAAHTDVVPVTPEQREVWVGSGPFSGEVIDGKLYGRGASDMKGAIAAYVMAAKILKDEGVELQGDLLLAQSPGRKPDGAISAAIPSWSAGTGPISLSSRSRRTSPSTRPSRVSSISS